MQGSPNSGLNRLYLKFNKQCFYCQRTIDLGEASRDHVYPKSKNGSGRKDNIVLACRRCNSVKGDLTDIDEVMAKINAYWERKYELQKAKAAKKMECERQLGDTQSGQVGLAGSQEQEECTTNTGSPRRVDPAASSASLGRLGGISQALKRLLYERPLTDRKNTNKVK